LESVGGFLDLVKSLVPPHGKKMEKTLVSFIPAPFRPLFLKWNPYSFFWLHHVTSQYFLAGFKHVWRNPGNQSLDMVSEVRWYNWEGRTSARWFFGPAGDVMRNHLAACRRWGHFMIKPWILGFPLSSYPHVSFGSKVKTIIQTHHGNYKS
jgi:hypothetical protein